MNENILEFLEEQKRVSVAPKDKKQLLFFLNYMDKHSLRLQNIRDEIFYFTNDAEMLWFSLEEMLGFVKKMKEGCPFPWTTFR